MTDCPFPELDIKGFTTQDIPVNSTAFDNSSKEVAYLYFAVFTPTSIAAKSRIAFLFMVKFAAFALGTT